MIDETRTARPQCLRQAGIIFSFDTKGNDKKLIAKFKTDEI